MKRRLHLIALVLFVLSLLYDIVVWGSLPRLPDVGASIAASARRQAPLAATYIWLGSPVDGALSPLQAFGEKRLTNAFGENFPRIRADASVAMDLVFNQTSNSQSRWIRIMYWAAPIFLLLSLILWGRRPKPVRVFGARR
jgi:hypothetical protein